jgi:hypothetical protein
VWQDRRGGYQRETVCFINEQNSSQTRNISLLLLLHTDLKNIFLLILTIGAVLIFFGIELSGCLGPEAQHICKQMAGVGGEDWRRYMKVCPLVSRWTEPSESSILSSVVCLVSVWEWKRWEVSAREQAES